MYLRVYIVCMYVLFRRYQRDDFQLQVWIL